MGNYGSTLFHRRESCDEGEIESVRQESHQGLENAVNAASAVVMPEGGGEPNLLAIAESSLYEFYQDPLSHDAIKAKKQSFYSGTLKAYLKTFADEAESMSKAWERLGICDGGEFFCPMGMKFFDIPVRINGRVCDLAAFEESTWYVVDSQGEATSFDKVESFDIAKIEPANDIREKMLRRIEKAEASVSDRSFVPGCGA